MTIFYRQQVNFEKMQKTGSCYFSVFAELRFYYIKAKNPKDENDRKDHEKISGFHEVTGANWKNNFFFWLTEEFLKLQLNNIILLP